MDQEGAVKYWDTLCTVIINMERAHPKALRKQSLDHSAQARLAMCRNQMHFLKSQGWMTTQNMAGFGLKNRNYCYIL
jgi:hypothetical protein